MRKILSFLSPLFVISLVYAANLPIKVHPAIVFSPDSITFPPLPVGTPTSQAITVLNSGPVTVPIGSITITGTNSADFGQTNTCGASITSSASCAITVSFTPTINAAETAQLNLNASGTPGHSYSVSLTASGFLFSIGSVSVTPNTFPGGSVDGTPVGAIVVNVASRTNSPPGFTGTLALASMANFRLSSSTLPANLLLNGTQAAGSYTAGIIPTQAGLSNSGSTFNVPITGTAPGSGPSPTLTLNVSPSSPVISATTPLNTKIADLAAVWSDASTFSGTFNFVTPNFDSGGTYATLGNGLIISPNGPGVGGAGGTTENVSMQAVQGSTNSSIVTVPITITSTSETVFDNAGSPWNFLNQINAVNYDQCGSGCAYVVINPRSCDSTELAYRSDCANFKTYPSSPGFRLGFSAAGDLYKYTISVPQTGTYALNALLSDAFSGGSWQVLIDGVVVGTIPTPNTGSWDIFSLSQSSSFTLNAGTHVLGLRVNGGDALNGAGDLVYVQGFHPSPTPPPGSSVCDQGPNAPTPAPAPAMAAGFTTCALNADFTSSAYSSLSSWMDCGPSFPNSKWQFSMTWWGRSGSSCNRAQMTTDSGVQVLNLFSPTSDGVYVSLNWPGYWQDGTPGNYLPLELYVEITFRTSPQSLIQSPVVEPFDAFNVSSGGNGRPLTNQWIEDDFFEYSTGGNVNGSGLNTGSGIIAWGNPNCSNGQCFDNTAYWSFDPTQYHTIGTLITGDEHSIISKCVFMDGVWVGHCDQLNSAGWTTPEPALFTQHNNTVNMWLGLGQTNQVDLYFKSIRVWECSGYQTQGCPGTVITSWPP